MLIEKKRFESLLKDNKAASLRPFKGECFNVYRNLMDENSKLVDVIEFKNGKYHIIDARKNHYLELGEYLVTFGSHHDEENIIDFEYAHIFRLSDAEEFPVYLSGKTYSGCMVVLDRKLIAVCDSKSCPQFLIIMNGDLRLISNLVAEQIIRNFALDEKQIKSIVKMFPEYGWKIINNIPINPETFDVPSSFHVQEWKKRTRTKKLSHDSKINSYYSTLLRDDKKETPQIKFIHSSDF